MPVEFADDGAGRGREGGQLVQFADVQESPVAAGVEQDALRGIDQVRRDRLRLLAAGPAVSPAWRT